MSKPRPPQASAFGSPPSPTLLERAGQDETLGGTPLADRMRPRRLDEVLGQKKLLGEGKLLRRMIETDRLKSLILWGPPGVGKTSLARVIAESTKRNFVAFSAVLGGVPELRTIIKQADEDRRYRAQGTILFLDEIHRFNKAQQDALLPHVEAGTVSLIGATTENPSFAVNAAILSRTQVLRLESLEEADLVELLERTCRDPKRGLGKLDLEWEAEALSLLARSARGDARRALGLLETVAIQLEAERGERLPKLSVPVVERSLDSETLLYDKQGEEHYNLISAFIKSMRGSDPDASVYYLFRMLDAGEDPLFLMRRMLIFASEDVGNADPRALSLVESADAAFRRMGMPEGQYPLAHACLYLAACPKSDAVGKAYMAAKADIARYGALPVPMKLRNAPTQLMGEQGYGRNYQYAHDFEEGFAPGETYLPERLLGHRYYQPTQHGLEKAISERLERIFKRREPGN